MRKSMYDLITLTPNTMSLIENRRIDSLRYFKFTLIRKITNKILGRNMDESNMFYNLEIDPETLLFKTDKLDDLKEVKLKNNKSGIIHTFNLLEYIQEAIIVILRSSPSSISAMFLHDWKNGKRNTKWQYVNALEILPNVTNGTIYVHVENLTKEKFRKLKINRRTKIYVDEMFCINGEYDIRFNNNDDLVLWKLSLKKDKHKPPTTFNQQKEMFLEEIKNI